MDCRGDGGLLHSEHKPDEKETCQIGALACAKIR
jgi:hypothetical protein